MTLNYRHDYFGDSRLLASFEAYALKIHGLDFSVWKEKGLWDRRYVAFSAFDGEVCVASICVYPSSMVINGVERTGAQLLTVGTLVDYRRQGVQRELWKRVESWVATRSDFVFLFTDDEAGGFYARLGFDRVVEHSEIIAISPETTLDSVRVEKLDLALDDHYMRLRRLAFDHEWVSRRLGFDNPNLLLFMYLYLYRDSIYYLEDLDTIVVVTRRDDRLRVHDILAGKLPGFTELLPFFSHFSPREIEFLFCTDRLSPPAGQPRQIEDSLLFIYGDLGLDGSVLFPDSIRA